ncbi:hypothetical protein HAX54_046501, partial [Datura stramonium]|nr:hypothetical protein [Datura stramonium]
MDYPLSEHSRAFAFGLNLRRPLMTTWPQRMSMARVGSTYLPSDAEDEDSRDGE